MLLNNYDIIVVGGGHAGCEAAAAAGRLGSKVLLITLSVSSIARMSCNPAMGGIAKGQILREIDALGGYSGIVTDHTMIQFRMLNRSKGPAMWSPRAQNDRTLFGLKWQHILNSIPNVHIWQDMVDGVLIERNFVKGVHTKVAGEIFSQRVIITSGTFLNGVIHIGNKNFTGGRLGESSASGLTNSLLQAGIVSERLKTGTPVRVDKRSVDLLSMTEQKGDDPPGRFSFTETPVLKDQLSCYLCYTNDQVHDILRLGFEQSPLYTGRIKGTGPRYCPSIEDKIDRFASRNRHQLFVEPDGRDSNELYINGFSSSLPIEIQFKALRSIPGFENARIVQPGYAIEYDFFPPTQLDFSLESKIIKNLYFAGQVNGTTGYEEAAAQGLMAGINASRSLNKADAIILKRSDAYIGVLIDDLVTKGTLEPYRMFTSRAEFRILLRQDNADQRLTPLGDQIGLISNERVLKLENKLDLIHNFYHILSENNADPDNINTFLENQGTAKLTRKVKYLKLVLRPQIKLTELIQYDAFLKDAFLKHKHLSNFNEAVESLEIQIKYGGYLEKEREIAEKINRLENITIPDDINYLEFKAMSMEAREKLMKIRPKSIGQASRISGITPSDISVLLVFLGR